MEPTDKNIDFDDDNIYDYVLEKNVKQTKNVPNNNTTSIISKYFTTSYVLILIIVIAIIIFLIYNRKWLLA